MQAMIIAVWRSAATQRRSGQVDLKAMRRSCAALVDDLAVSDLAATGQLIGALCNRMGQRLGRPVRHRLVRFPPDTVSGLFVATDDANYVLCEQLTTPWHQTLITGHELWHIEADHRATPVGREDATRLLFPSLEPHTVARIVSARTHCVDAEEQEAEMFASLLLARVGRWLPQQLWTVPAHALEVVDRVAVALGCEPGRTRG